MTPPELRDAMVDITTFEEADTEAVTDLWNEVFPDPAPRNRPECIIRDKLRVQRDLFFVARRDDVIVGTAMGGFDGRRGWVYAVAVRPSHQRHGIGARLMAEVEASLAARGCPKLNLQVVSSNDAVVAFYESLGYAVEERVSMGKVLDQV